MRFRSGEGVRYGSLLGDTVTEWSKAPWLGGKRLSQTYYVKDIELIAPCDPKKIVATAANYPGVTGVTEKTAEPLIFVKPSSSVIGSGETITSVGDLPVWGECELGLLVGKKLRHASPEEALDSIFGFTVGNDVTCENSGGWDHHLARSKAADSFCVIGPWIDTTFNPTGKEISGYQNGSLVRQGRCDDRFWKEPDLLVWLSKWMTLEPGDLVLTGAPSRVVDRVYLKNGDNYRCVVEDLGEICNPFSEYHEI